MASSARVDPRLTRTYEAWEIAKEVEMGWDRLNSSGYHPSGDKDQASVAVGKGKDKLDGKEVDAQLNTGSSGSLG